MGAIDSLVTSYFALGAACTGFFLHTPKKTETEKLSFKKLRLKIEKN